jgi:hypothetical protein
MQHAAADKAGMYKPYVQEDEIEANAAEARYMAERIRRDAGFKAMFLKMEKNTSYAQKRMALMERFGEGPSKFDRMIRQVYYHGLPSAGAAASQILSAVSAELERRKSLDAAEAAEIERSGAGLGDALGMTMRELVGSVGEIKTPVLKKIQEDMLNRPVAPVRSV